MESNNISSKSAQTNDGIERTRRGELAKAAVSLSIDNPPAAMGIVVEIEEATKPPVRSRPWAPRSHPFLKHSGRSPRR